MTPDLAAPLPATTLEPLRRQIGWLCQFVRFAAAAYALWVVWGVSTLWLNKGDVAAHFGRWLKVDLSGIQAWQRALGFAEHALICAFVTAACWSAWKLFSGYLEGRIFTRDAGIWLRRIGLFGLGAEITDILTRPLTIMTVTAHLPPGQRHVGFALNQNDLAFLMLLTAIVALAHIFTKAAEIAQENEEIV
jgi:Protein of unknown function (DUF2975)